MNKYINKKNDFRKAPSSDILLDPQHGGQVLCMDSNSISIVQGSIDHGLRVYAISNGKQTRSLYTKQYGHTEWVTSCALLNDGRVVSTGMDNNICVWDAKGAKCKYIKEHTGSISKVNQ
jgi:WD40 repeat protein